MDLFTQNAEQLTASQAPLAARMRPLTLNEFVGQNHIIGPGRLLRRAIQADQLSSLIFYGPPGTGKTTLAQIIANTTHAHFIAINAVLAGVKDLRAAVEAAQERRGRYSQRTILFIDEVHRFNKAQQDALLPWVENGTLVLIGATTENPYFEVNSALVSRSRLFQLRTLVDADLQQVAQQALTDPKRGYGTLKIQLEPAALTHLIQVANGDARALLNALELAVETTPPDSDGVIAIDVAIAEESIQQRAVLYDKEGDAHFDTISAFIKSLRGSDPDAALYWLARMIYAGEDPRFILRRMLILASEDIGLADPQAIVVTQACAATFDRIGLPEGYYPLAQAALYLATAPKSNSVMGFFDALKAVEQAQTDQVPNHLKDPSRDKHSFGHGANYHYPHAYRDHWVAQQYLPSNLQGQMFYQPSEQGAEAQIQARLAQRREAQLAAQLESATTPEILSYSPQDSMTERWLQRTINSDSEQLASLRQQMFSRIQLQRHHLVLDLQAGGGLLTWEALRHVPEGGVYSQVVLQAEAEALESQAQKLPGLRRPVILQTELRDLPASLCQQDPALRFEVILGRNLLFTPGLSPDWLVDISPFLQPQGTLLLAETLPKLGQRISALVDSRNLEQMGFEPTLYQRWQAAEAQMYEQAQGTRLGADPEQIKALFTNMGLTFSIAVELYPSRRYLSAGLLQHWLTLGQASPSYADLLAPHLSRQDVDRISEAISKQFLKQTVTWQVATAFVSLG